MAEHFHYTKYSSVKPQKSSEFGPKWLEETHRGPLDPKIEAEIRKKDPSAIRDLDGDGYQEFEKSATKRIIKNKKDAHIPLATFFGDTPSLLEKMKRVLGLPLELIVPTYYHDFGEARKYFTQLAVGEENPLAVVAEPLAKHLAASMMHSGIDLDDSVSIKDQQGLSVHGSGRLRGDCLAFAELAHSNLRNIPGLTFKYIKVGQGKVKSIIPSGHSRLSPSSVSGIKSLEYDIPKGLKDDSASAHVVLLVSDKEGRSLLVDNNKVDYLRTQDSHAFIRSRYSQHVGP